MAYVWNVIKERHIFVLNAIIVTHVIRRWRDLKKKSKRRT